ncbi:HDOD domain-containing protein [Uliginosibacterium sp. H3]|uniref:HDOD domain-containing protein n=1 Tax=Uliginosibacterium silvisoli TaxID=3114758 RepID=A0ABU6K6J3_9RHOO|nr:HDOD domain-containing protein [Uliginosibacterium sp. H3]
MIAAPLTSIDSYIAYFSQAPLPVLRRTVRALAELRADEDSVSGRRIATVVLQDPLMTLRVLVYIEANRRSAQNHDITTIERAIMMIGITPFFDKFSDLPTVEEQLGSHPRSLLGVLHVIARARQAASYARDWAVIRHDLDVDEVTVAALLHEAAEILCWCFAPELMQRITQQMLDTPGLRSAKAQSDTLGFDMHEIQLALVNAWHLPELLITLMDDDQAHNPRVRNVVLANNLARHASKGWQDPALPDDYSAVASLLHMSNEQLLKRLDVPPEFWPSTTKDSADPLVG